MDILSTLPDMWHSRSGEDGDKVRNAGDSVEGFFEEMYKLDPVFGCRRAVYGNDDFRIAHQIARSAKESLEDYGLVPIRAAGADEHDPDVLRVGPINRVVYTERAFDNILEEYVYYPMVTGDTARLTPGRVGGYPMDFRTRKMTIEVDPLEITGDNGKDLAWQLNYDTMMRLFLDCYHGPEPERIGVIWDARGNEINEGDVGHFIVNLEREMPPIGSLRLPNHTPSEIGAKEPTEPISLEEPYCHVNTEGETYWLNKKMVPLFYFSKKIPEYPAGENEIPPNREIGELPNKVPNLKKKE